MAQQENTEEQKTSNDDLLEKKGVKKLDQEFLKKNTEEIKEHLKEEEEHIKESVKKITGQ